MSVASTRAHASEVRCADRLEAAGRRWGLARWLYENGMPAGSFVEEDLARDEEQRAEAELRRGHRPDAELVLSHDYEARLNDYIERRMSRLGPLAELVDPDRFAGQHWYGNGRARRILRAREEPGNSRQCPNLQDLGQHDAPGVAGL